MPPLRDGDRAQEFHEPWLSFLPKLPAGTVIAYEVNAPCAPSQLGITPSTRQIHSYDSLCLYIKWNREARPACDHSSVPMLVVSNVLKMALRGKV